VLLIFLLLAGVNKTWDTVQTYSVSIFSREHGVLPAHDEVVASRVQCHCDTATKKDKGEDRTILEGCMSTLVLVQASNRTFSLQSKKNLMGLSPYDAAEPNQGIK
jgi:hypothetical protein